MDRPALSSSIVVPSGRSWKDPLLLVIPYNETFYPALCRQGEGFGVLYKARPVQPAGFEVRDPSGEHLLFHGPCEPGAVGVCMTSRFCPTQDVLVRVIGRDGAQGSTSLRAGPESLQCPPIEEWLLTVDLLGPYAPRLPGTSLLFDVRVLGAPDRLLAFDIHLQLQPGVTFLSFQTSLPGEHVLSGRGLAVIGDASGAVIVGGLLGRLEVRLDAEHAGLLRVMQITGVRLLVKGGWFSVGVLGRGGSCLRGGFVDILADFPRCTALIPSPTRTQLVHWRGVQDDAPVFSMRLGAVGVWNTRRVGVVNATCVSLTTGVLKVTSCNQIVPCGTGKGLVLVRSDGQEAFVRVQVLLPTDLQTLFFPDGGSGMGRLVVLGRLLGRMLDITPFVLPMDVVECPPGENRTVGMPVLRNLECGAVGSGRPDVLFLLAGNWTRNGGFRLLPSVLGVGGTRAAGLFFRGKELLSYPLTSGDAGRVVADDGWLRLVQEGGSPRCVVISRDWKVPVLPAAPVSLDVKLSRSILVVQQDLLKLVPCRAELAWGSLVLTDGSRVDVRDRLQWDVSGSLQAGPGWLGTRFQAGPANVTFRLAGFPCVTVTLHVSVFASSVVSAVLVCPRCPAVLAADVDPLARRWPTSFPSRVPVQYFVVRRLLVDGSTHDGYEALSVQGAGVLEGEEVVAVRQGTLSVSTSFTKTDVLIPVIQRWAVDWRMLCNGRPCDPMAKLAPEGDGAGMPPFRYPTVLEVAVELTLGNGTTLVVRDPPKAALIVNGERVAFPRAPLHPGPLVVRVAMDVDWEFLPSEAAVGFEVHTMTSLELSVPSVLLQLHCTRRWERGELNLRAALSDGVRAAVSGAVVADGTFLRLDRTGVYVEALWPGKGWVNATFGNFSVSVQVLVSMDSRFFSGLSLDAVPGVWAAPLLSRLPMHATLEPVVLTGGRMDLLGRVVRWQADPPGILDVLPSGELLLRSDHYEPVLLSGVIRSCQGSPPLVFRRSVQVNVVADRPWQVDFGQDGEGPPLPEVRVGGLLSVPVYLYCESPLALFKAVVSLPGLDLVPTCIPGELPLSKCISRADSVEFSGSFAASQRVGRVLLGILQGTVLVDGLSRLRVGLAEPGNTTYEFTVRLGAGQVHSVVSRVNSVEAGFSEPDAAGWQGQAPASLTACCDVLAVGSGSSIAHLVPCSFHLKNITLQPGGEVLALTDPRLSVEFDRLVLDFDPVTGIWKVGRMVPIFMEFTEIQLGYRHPGADESLHAVIRVNFTEPLELLLVPEQLVLRRVHCSNVFFQSHAVLVRLALRDGTILPLLDADIANVSAGDGAVVGVTVERDRLSLKGLAVGNVSVVVSAFWLNAAVTVVVLDDSVVLRSVRLPDPYVVQAPYGQPVSLTISGTMDDGEELLDASFLVESATTSSPVLAWHAGSIVAKENTLPGQQAALVVVVPACSYGPALVVTSSLAVRLQPGSLPDVVVEPGLSDFVISIAADMVLAFLVSLDTDGANPVCLPGPDLPVFSDCCVDGGKIVLAGSFSEPRPGPVALAVVTPMPRVVHGFLELFSGLSGSTRTEIVAGRFGPNVSVVPVSLPVVDPATLARQYLTSLSRPWDAQAARDANFTLQLLTGRQRLVDVRLYSNEFELSVMLGVTDRFLAPDEDRTVIDVTFLTKKLPTHPNETEVAGGVRIRARHFIDGWYVVQWMESIPHLSLLVSYQVSTTTSLGAWEHAVEKPLITGRPLHECPRLATDRASFLVEFRIPGPVPADWVDANFACAMRVPPRRVSLFNPGSGVVIASVAFESFIRIAQAYQAIRMKIPGGGRRLLDAGATLSGLRYINDTADPPLPCPSGTYYTRNGTYERLPLHAVLGPDCYGMSCVEGYVLAGAECVPAPVPVELAWVCVVVLLSSIVLISCVLCALYLGRRIPTQPLDMMSDSWPGSSHPSEPFAEDEQEFRNIVLGTYLDDYSKDMLDDDFTPAAPALTPSCRHATT